MTTTDVTLTVTNQPGPAAYAGRTFVARIIHTGDRYGRNRCITNDGKPMIEFLDATYAGKDGFDVLGQFTGGRYYVETLLGNERHGRRLTGGLNLDGGIDVWTIDAEAMNKVYAWLDEHFPEED